MDALGLRGHPEGAWQVATSMTDGQLRTLCNAFFDAIETNDLDAVTAIYAPDFAMWDNFSQAEHTREDNLKVLREGKAVARRRTYDDRRISTFDGGFMVQYSVNVVQHDGPTRSLWSCLIAQCRDGQITRIDEYLDSSKFGRPRKEASA
jgi:ketosteroid isomerase-like protein